MKLFENRNSQVPVWFMRQAGRYHAHYQNIRRDQDFMNMCKTPKLACEITMGPINEFDFDAAILFSDLLFPLELLGLGLHYNDGPPKLTKHLTDLETVKNLRPIDDSKIFFNFQKEATSLLRKALPNEKNLIGFCGAPFTLYTYATEGSHAGNLIEAKKGLYDGRFDEFMKLLVPVIIEEAKLQIEGGADTISLFDTAVGELHIHEFSRFIAPRIREVTNGIKEAHPEAKIIYYSKLTQTHYIEELADKNIDVLGIDWRNNLATWLKKFSKDYYIQGNMDPSWLFLDWTDLKANMDLFYKSLSECDRSKWICGLGHGVLPKTPQENVKKAVDYIQNNFKC